MKTFCKTLAITALVTAAAIAIPATAEASVMYRMYNPYSGEHFYTASTAERDNLICVGWNYEGAGWDAPETGDDVYRLYNPYGGDHHYTLSTHERDCLVNVGWLYEGVGWKSADPKNGVPLYRQYNPYASSGSHNYTTSKTENDYLASIGWNAEGIGWYGTKQSDSVCRDTNQHVNDVINDARNQLPTVVEQPTSKDNLWWHSQATGVKTLSTGDRVYTFNDTNQPGCVTQVIERGPNDSPTSATIFTRQTPDKTETYVKEEAWDEELYHYESRVYDPYTDTYYDTYKDWSNAHSFGLTGPSYNNVSVKIHDGWKHHDAVMDERTIPGEITQKAIKL